MSPKGFDRTFGFITGGQKVIRCELSLDDGQSWRLTDIKRIQEKPNRGGKYWAWVFWEIPVSTGAFIEISKATMPELIC